jgi:hypothetical protein
MFFCDFAFPGSAMSAFWATQSLFEPSMAIQASVIPLSRHFPAHIFRKAEVRPSEMSLLKKPDSRDGFHKLFENSSWSSIAAGYWSATQEWLMMEYIEKSIIIFAFSMP